MFPAPILPFIRESSFAVRNPWHLTDRRLLDYLLIYVQEGLCIVRMDGVDVEFHAGDFCLLQPSDVHTLGGKTNTITPYAHLDIFYNPRREEGWPALPGQVDMSAYSHIMQPRLNDIEGIHIPLKFQPSQPAHFRDTLLKMVGTWQHRDPVSQLEAQQLATELVVMLLKDFSHARAASFQVPQSLNWITSYLSLRLSEPVSVADMARRVQLSPSRFSAVFRQRFGMPPHQYLLHLRVQHAQELLKSTTLSQQQVAAYAGFTDIYHFSKTFKKITGLTPGAFRRAASRVAEDESAN